MKRKYTRYNLDMVKAAFMDEGYELSGEKYINPHTKLKYICSKGHKHSISWHKWMHGRRCPYCSSKAKYKIEDVRRHFEYEGYTLLTDIYENVFAKLEYTCNRGHRGNITWHNWNVNGARCMECKHENMFMHGNPNWKGGMSCEPYCYEWSFKEFKDFIKERDGNKCLNPDCCRTAVRLGVHHINYNKKNCKPQNLITLCTSCNSRANHDREWHKAWYQAILYRRYGHWGLNNGAK